ncbi:MAG: primosomal protein N', partial [Planctomycetaceae bacterium]|nr:primosomal protein N' [Planctomycetaceae bacterium]
NVPLKSIQSRIDEHRLLNDKMLELTRWIAQHYLCPVGQVFEAMLPAGVRSHAGTRLTTVLYLAEDADKRLAVLRRSDAKEKGIILTSKQLHVLETLRQSAEPLTISELQHAAKCSAVPINSLKRLGIFRAKTIRRQKPETDVPVQKTLEVNPYQLNSDQQRVLTIIQEAIQNNRHETFLLHGVTGSGKTEVYIQAIHEVVRRKRQAIVLVPEISLTPQTVGRFKSRFPDVAVLHSHLTDAERHRQWTSIAEGNVQLVVGARSAVFAPFPKLGLIVIDEEHENSFKQDSAPRYHARDVARKRAELEHIPLILGSATPSLESWHDVNRRSVHDSCVTNFDSCTQLISMPNRVKNLRLPLVEIVDLREEIRNRSTRGAIHRQLHVAIRSALNEKGQVILLLNRRGFSTHIQCPSCGGALKCPNCDVSLTHHKTEEIALCHYCDYQIPAPTRCPQCRFPGIWYGGFGTQKLETEIKSRFPDASVLRMDTDTMQGYGAHERAFLQFREGKVQILLGTQMIAKGLDFPNVTLVGVINADTALHLPDFRASERTFHLITQVAGRTGRGERGGRVIIQTFSPDHPAILAASRHDFQTFVAQELPMRKLLGYPPYTKMIRIVIRGENETKTREFAIEFADRLKTFLSTSAKIPVTHRILGPAPAPFAKLRGFYRFHIHLHDVNGEHLRNSVRSVSLALKTPADVQWIIDIDPIDML